LMLVRDATPNFSLALFILRLDLGIKMLMTRGV
jgi:hypothetical protein